MTLCVPTGMLRPTPTWKAVAPPWHRIPGACRRGPPGSPHWPARGGRHVLGDIRPYFSQRFPPEEVGAKEAGEPAPTATAAVVSFCSSTLRPAFPAEPAFTVTVHARRHDGGVEQGLENHALVFIDGEVVRQFIHGAEAGPGRAAVGLVGARAVVHRAREFGVIPAAVRISRWDHLRDW